MHPKCGTYRPTSASRALKGQSFTQKLYGKQHANTFVPHGLPFFPSGSLCEKRVIIWILSSEQGLSKVGEKNEVTEDECTLCVVVSFRIDRHFVELSAQC